MMIFNQVKYKPSYYNVVFERNGEKYLCNTYSGALAHLDEDDFIYLQSTCQFDEDCAHYGLLKSNGFIVDTRINEYGRILHNQKQMVFSKYSKRISVVISLGSGCNYMCRYCFQRARESSSPMTVNKAIDIAEYICKLINDNHTAKELHITWFGGEPLLYVDAIDIITRRVSEFIAKKDITFDASIITNGRLLDNSMVERLKSLSVTRAQITIDGMCDGYCLSKGVLPIDFITVIENVCCAANEIKVTVRLNIPGNDSSEAIKITDYLLCEKQLRGRIRLYMAYLRDYTLSKEAAKQEYRNYVDNHVRWLTHISINYSLSVIGLSAPQRRYAFCSLINSCNICIDSEGLLYKCEHDLGDPQFAIGDVYSGHSFCDRELSYAQTIESRHECVECKYLPVCMGGCLNDTISDLLGQDCDAYKKMYQWQKLLEGGVIE